MDLRRGHHGPFDSLDWGWLRTFIQHRINDGGILRLIGKWLNAGIMEGDAPASSRAKAAEVVRYLRGHSPPVAMAQVGAVFARYDLESIGKKKGQLQKS